MIRCLCLALLLGPVPLLPAAEPARDFRLAPDLSYQARRLDPITHEVDFSAVVTAPYHCKLLRVWLPLPQTDRGQEISDSRLSTFPREVEPRIGTEPRYGNRFAYFEFHNPQGAQMIRHRFRARVWELRWGLDPDRVTRPDRWPDSFAPYLRPQAVSDEKALDRLLAEIAPSRDRPGRSLLNVMSWINTALTYDHASASLRADADHALSLRRGHCSDYHGLCATMASRLGHPSRVTYGLSLYPKNSPSHCKMEAFLPPHGWVSFDLSETQQLVKKIQQDEALSPARKARLTGAALDRLRTGFRENSWLLLTRGTDYDLVPKASRPVRVVRTIFAEADGEPLPEPDPADGKKREFAWMTLHRYSADRPLTLPFKDLDTLEPWVK